MAGIQTQKTTTLSYPKSTLLNHLLELKKNKQVHSESAPGIKLLLETTE